jgi:magnesium chelatase family protein
MTTSSSGTRAALVRGATLTGLTATLIGLQASIDPAKQGFEILGVPGDATWTLRDRVRAAVLNSAMAWPQAGIIVELAPWVRFRHGCGLDLAIAVAILAAGGRVSSPGVTGYVFVAELGLDGQLRPVQGLVQVLRAAAEATKPVTAMIAPGNLADAAAVPGVMAVACTNLEQVAAWLRGDHEAAERLVPVNPAGPSGPDRPADKD